MSRIDSVSEGGEVAVRGFVHLPDNATGDAVALTHGAGTNCEAPLLVELATAFCASGATVLRFDLPFRQARRSGPPIRGSAERDQEGIGAAVSWLRKRGGERILLAGHSYGGRQASLLAARDPGLVNLLLLLSYPFHPPEKPAKLRTQHFPQLKTPCFFVQGTRDGFGSIEEMTAALRLIPAPNRLLEIAGAGHELMDKRNRAERSRSVAEAVLSFADQLK